MREETTGWRVKQRREQLELSQAEVSRRAKLVGYVGISQPHFSEIEGDKKKPGLETLLSLAYVLETSIDYLACRVSDPSPVREGAEDSAVYFSEEADTIARIVDRFSPARRGELLRIVEAIAEAHIAEEREVQLSVIERFSDVLEDTVTGEQATAIVEQVKAGLLGGRRG